MTSSQFCWKGPGVLSSTNTWSCLHVMLCTNASCCMVWWVWACVVAWWLSARGKREGATTQSNKNKKDFSQNHFFPFPFFLLFFLPLFSPDLPLFHYHSLLIHTRTYFSCFTRECVCEESKTLMMQHLIHFIVFSSFPNSLFLFFSFCKWFSVDYTITKYYQIIK